METTRQANKKKKDKEVRFLIDDCGWLVSKGVWTHTGRYYLYTKDSGNPKKQRTGVKGYKKHTRHRALELEGYFGGRC